MERGEDRRDEMSITRFMGRFILLIFTILNLLSCASSERLFIGEEYAKKILSESLADTSNHNLITSTRLVLKNNDLAIQVAEPILFSIYGKRNIRNEKPYESYLINNYWIIKGTLPKDYVGGTFLIILDARDSKIIRLTHGK